MKFVDEFQKINNIQVLLHKIDQLLSKRTVAIMEVCGTHTMAIAKYGIRSILPENIRLISGPGCPVCVTSIADIDIVFQLTRNPDVILCTFGDMIRVPGSQSSLELEKQQGVDIRIVTSTLEALTIAKENPNKEIVFLGIGFETTAPTVALSIVTANEKKLTNFSVLSLHKTMPGALRSLCNSELNIDGFLLPGHVSAIIGAHPYEFLVEQYNKACVISGFEPFDILWSIYLLVSQIVNQQKDVEIQYKRIVSDSGNPDALEVMNRVFYSTDALWRGLGKIPNSGLDVRNEYNAYNARYKFQLNEVENIEENSGCQCGDILRGVLEPSDCRLFATQCTPENPIGPCMVSQEGACAARYRYQEKL